MPKEKQASETKILNWILVLALCFSVGFITIGFSAYSNKPKIEGAIAKVHMEKKCERDCGEPIMTTPVGSSASLTVYSDGMFELNGSIGTEMYLRYDGENSIVSNIRSDILVNDLLFPAGSVVRLSYFYVSGTTTAANGKEFNFSLRNRASGDVMNEVRISAIGKSTDGKVFDYTQDTSVQNTIQSDASFVTGFFHAPRTFDHLKFYITAEKIE
ncbi:MAG: hypothetical protein MJ154_02580 [Candidatus Saccharibacteria bacterium]|nr:hypothetical protein [Candidatus Saccharibacteria bacterium]